VNSTHPPSASSSPPGQRAQRLAGEDSPPAAKGRPPASANEENPGPDAGARSATEVIAAAARRLKVAWHQGVPCQNSSHMR
jgi:hypothetical protein